MKLLILFNPNAGSGRAAGLQSHVETAMAEAGLEAQFVLTRSPEHANELVRSSQLRDFDVLVVGGGDGSLFPVVNSLCQLRKEQRPPLAILPLGTGNAFCRDLGLHPGGWEQAIELITQGHTTQVDVASVETSSETFYFLNIIGLGFVVEAATMAGRLKFLGKSAYTLGTLLALPAMKSSLMQMELDGESMSLDSVFVEVSNSRYTGTNFLIAPGARLDDGLLDVTIVRNLPRLRLLRLFPTIFEGRHVEFDEVVTRQAAEIRISAPVGMGLAPDGEFRGETPVTIRCLGGELEMFGSLPA